MISRLLGLDQEGPITYFDWFFRHPWGGVGVMLLIAAAIAYSVFMYRREKTLSLPRRLFLATVRATLYSLLAVMLLEPVLGFEMQVKIRRSLLVMLDTSQSMGIKDPRKTPAEIEEAAKALGAIDFKDTAMAVSEKARQDALDAGLPLQPQENAVSR
jgi:hypothetical protein